MKRSRSPHALWVLFLGLTVSAVSPALGNQMLAIEYDTGNIYDVDVSPTDVTLTLLGSTEIAGFGSLEFAPDGTLYGFTTGLDPGPKLYEIEIDPRDFTVTATVIGELGLDNVFDGSLVFAPDGTVYGTNRGATTSPQLFTIDINTGEATVIGTISVGGDTEHDINAMGWRNDGMLVGLDRVANALLAIDPADATAEIIANVTPDVGFVGGMAVWGETGYFATSGPDPDPNGSNELYAFDLFSGQHQLLGSFDGTITTGNGISGLAIVPEPASLLLVAAGGLVFLRRRWSKP